MVKIIFSIIMASIIMSTILTQIALELLGLTIFYYYPTYIPLSFFLVLIGAFLGYITLTFWSRSGQIQCQGQASDLG